MEQLEVYKNYGVFKDYIKKYLEIPNGWDSGKEYPISTVNVMIPFISAKFDDIDYLKVTKKEYTALVSYFTLSYDWDGKKIWGIELVKIS